MSGGQAASWTDAERAAVALLAGLERMTTHRLRSLLAAHGPVDAVDAIRCGIVARSPTSDRSNGRDLVRTWQRSVANDSIDRVVDQLDRLGVRVLGPADDEWPATLHVDPNPPAVLFVDGRLDERRRVAIVGTRNPTERGRQLAARFGYELAAADLAIVSGLAIGIDGAAHRGALGAPTGSAIGVVANGHDRPYPRRHTALWREVAARGAVVSEWPPGTPPDAFRFPQRNRIIAALAEVVIVVESRETGGSLLTARDAAERGVQVMAIPGPPDSRASRGTNQLVQDGAALVLEVADVLMHLGLDHSRCGAAPVDPRPRPDADAAALLDAVRSRPRTIERLATDLDLDLGVVAMGLARLERSGWVFEVDGWFEALDEWALLLRPRLGADGSGTSPVTNSSESGA